MFRSSNQELVLCELRFGKPGVGAKIAQDG
jgi:hypothetical protein